MLQDATALDFMLKQRDLLTMSSLSYKTTRVVRFIAMGSSSGCQGQEKGE